LGIGKKFSLEGQVFLDRGSARSGPGDRPQGDLSALLAYQDLRRRADDPCRAEIEKVHVGRGIERAQRAIHIDRPRTKRHAEPLRKDDLEDIAGADVFLRATYRALEPFAAEAGHEIAFVERLRIERFRIARSGMAQTEGELVETPAGLRIRLRLRGLRMHDPGQAALERGER